jgi:hypothetical protein
MGNVVRNQLRTASVLLGAALGVFAFSGTASAGSIGIVPNGGCLAYASSEGTVYFCDSDIRPTGTGYIDPFLRVNRDGAGGGPHNNDGTPDTYSSGWNTGTYAPDIVDLTPPEEGANDYDFSWSKALPAGEIGYETPPYPGATGDYALFTVDINQQGAQKKQPYNDLLSLNHFELYNCSTNDYSSLSQCSGGISFFNLFNVGDWVTFDYRNHTGSGSGDIDVYIPSGVGFGNQYVSLLDGWGCGITGLTCDTSDPNTGLFPDNDGFQEWISAGAPLETNTTPSTTTTPTTTPSSTNTPSTTNTPSGAAPEPTVMALLGAGLVLAGRRLRRRSSIS